MHPLSTASATSFLFTLLLFFHLTASLPSNGASNLSNGNQNFSCGDLTNITYPFTGAQRPSHCGPPEFHLECYHNLTTTLTVNSRPYRVTQVNQTSQTLRLSILILYDDSTCIHPFNTTTFDNSSFSLVPNHSTVSLFYGCENPGDMENFKLSCPWPEYSEGFFMIGDPVPGPPFMHKCQTSFQVPILRSQEQLRDEGLSLLVEVLKEGFDVSYSNARPYCGTGSSRFGGGRKIAIAISGAVAAIIAFSIIAMTFKLKNSQNVYSRSLRHYIITAVGGVNRLSADEVVELLFDITQWRMLTRDW
ncbi:hypothetical protein OIU84_014575 [Salix udensis]|uniref:Wall-associated receptor kinase galacturonan-binding domain-containing protein n=1 Tax=Salix udensis TaxID=889485 RepID=A0AAD6JC98_9ROSI|nr:hypothetical protein OIU84_014575 [Salix udensis]